VSFIPVDRPQIARNKGRPRLQRIAFAAWMWDNESVWDTRHESLLGESAKGSGNCTKVYT
jgi:hypothetical protein